MRRALSTLIPKRPNVAIVGVTGAVGQVCARGRRQAYYSFYHTQHLINLI